MIAAIAPVVGFISSFFIPDQIILGDSLHDTLRDLWSAGKKRAVWQLMAFNFFNAFFFDAVAAPSDIIKRSWAKVEPFVDGVFSNVLAVFLFSLAMHFTRQYFLQSNWRMIIFITTMVTVSIQWTVDFLCVFNVIRSQYFYMGVPLTYQIPVAIRGIVVSFATVEIADERFEASTYALITTMHAVAGPISTSLFKQIDAQFRAYKQDIATDTPYVRWQVAYCLLFCYGSRLFSNITLFLLPRQKKEAQELKMMGNTNPRMSVAMLVIGLFALVWGVTTNIMSIDPNSACLSIAGGPGC
ncbi:folate-Biopterin Transporter (FBT) family [Thraustotheca clavata]|uniref:Folate-Biopterin Transporter (FBT) family n=1 Tax=Thraustotheca clavata TaxID=74557 RepID=A0A1W0ACN8_9STRA|nr:folate-Biopterin Transporter (FBT) family [Thraustotheca clavata]